MTGDLRLLVMREIDAGGRAEGRRATPFGDAAALGGVDVDEVDGAGVEEPAHAVARDLALAGGDRDARALAHARHQRGVVVPVTGLLEPPDVERLDEPRETNRVLRRPAAVGVDGQDEVGPRRVPRRLDALGISLGRQAADLELAAGHARATIRLHLAADVGERLAVHVIAADRDDGQPLPMTPEQGADGLPEGLAREVPHGAVHAGDRLEQRLPVAARVAEREQALPDPLALENAEPADARRQLVVEEAHDLRALLAVVAVVDLADEPALGAHAGDDR